MNRDYNEVAKHKTYRLIRRLEDANEDETPKIILAINLVNLRYANSKGQTEVANAIGINQKNLSQWEHGEVAPSLRYLIAISRFYNVTIDDLLTLPK